MNDVPERLSAYDRALQHLAARRYTWCLTGVAGFIGSHLLETLLKAGQDVRGLDNFATGSKSNLDQVEGAVGSRDWRSFVFREGDVRNPADCAAVCEGADFVLHQAAMGSVPRSIADPRTSHEANVDGFLNMLIAARDSGIKRFVYASSSSVYGDHPDLPKVEHRVGEPLSPYAATKSINELYAAVFARSYGMSVAGLRYFNVFGPRQDPNGAYAAVIPRWIAALLANTRVEIYGDGETSRDFCYVENAVQANLLAVTSGQAPASSEVFNVAVGERTTLSELFTLLRDLLARRFPDLSTAQPSYADFRSGDVRHSQADIGRARQRLGYAPTHRIRDGLEQSLDWYVAKLARGAAGARS